MKRGGRGGGDPRVKGMGTGSGGVWNPERRERPGSKGDGNREWRGLEPGREGGERPGSKGDGNGKWRGLESERGGRGRDPGVKGMETGSGGVGTRMEGGRGSGLEGNR